MNELRAGLACALLSHYSQTTQLCSLWQTIRDDTDELEQSLFETAESECNLILVIILIVLAMLLVLYNKINT